MKRTFQRIIVESASNYQNYRASEATRLCPRRNYRTEPQIKEKKDKIVHPYKNVHPWKSMDQFSNDLVDNVIYNKDGIVVLNKPYGISNSLQTIARPDPNWNTSVGIPNSVDYTLSDVLEDVANKLGHNSLMIVKSPERHISGVAILASTESKANAVKKSLLRSRSSKAHANSYWVVTTKPPKSNVGHLELAITKKESPCKTYKQPVILTTWGMNEVKRGEVKSFDVRYRTISNAPEDLASLLEIKCSTTKWHALRVFSSTVLLSPILGDKIHGSRVKKVMGTYLNISPFVDAAKQLPILEQSLMERLKLTPSQRVIIPTHIHLRETTLVSFLSRGKDLKLVAPLPPTFQWTCDQLEFKIPNDNEENPQLQIDASQ